MNLDRLRAFQNSKEYEDKLTQRLETIKEGDNFFRRKEVIAKCAADPLYFINTFCWIQEPRYLDNTNLEFFLFPYQEKVIEDILQAETVGEDRLYEKSRDMGFTWMAVAYYLWRWSFSRGWIGLFGSRKQEEVDNKTISSFFGKLRYMYYRLPDWMQPDGFIKKKFDNENKFLNPQNNSLIQGESSNPNFGRDRRSSMAIVDELFLHEYAQEMWRNLAETAKTRIGISTPKPTRFAKTLKDAMKSNGWLRSTHWSEHPFKDKGWYEKEKLRYAGDEMGLRMELEMEYLSNPDILVYPQAELIKLGNFDYKSGLPFYVSMDWGSAPSATVFLWWQMQDGHWVLLEGLQVKEKAVDWYMPFLCPDVPVNQDHVYNAQQQEVMDRVRKWPRAMKHYGEAAHTKREMTTSTSVAQELMKEPYRIRLYYNPMAIGHKPRQEAVKQLIRNVVYFNSTHFCLQCLDALTMAHFPKTAGTREKDAPVHDDTADFRATVENFASNVIGVRTGIKEFIYNKGVQNERKSVTRIY